MSCGCNDTALPLVNNNCTPCVDCPPANAMNLPECLNGEPCEEVVFTECTEFKGSNLPALGVLSGDRLINVLTKLHQIINPLLDTPIPLATYTATATTSTPLVINYLGLGPVYKSTAGATSFGTTITVGSTVGLVAGMTLEVTTGSGVFAAGTTVSAVQSLTQFVISTAPSVALVGPHNVITATGSTHTIYKLSVAQGTPQTFKAFVGSNVKVSGTGTIV